MSLFWQANVGNFCFNLDTPSFPIFSILSFQPELCQINIHTFFVSSISLDHPSSFSHQFQVPWLQIFEIKCVKGWDDHTTVNGYALTSLQTWQQHIFSWSPVDASNVFREPSTTKITFLRFHGNDLLSNLGTSFILEILDPISLHRFLLAILDQTFILDKIDDIIVTPLFILHKIIKNTTQKTITQTHTQTNTHTHTHTHTQTHTQTVPLNKM